MKVIVEKRKGVLDIVKRFVKNKVMKRNRSQKVIDGSIKYNKFK